MEGLIHLNDVEILDLNEHGLQCQQPPDPYPFNTVNHVGGIYDNQLMFCGGKGAEKMCHSLNPDDGNWDPLPNTLEEREGSTAVVTPSGKIHFKIKLQFKLVIKITTLHLKVFS